VNGAERWQEQARYDLDTARVMFDTGRHLYVLFCCQQAVEKMLKAVIVLRTKAFPPRIHSLVRLAAAASLDLDEERIQFLRELSSYYVQTRYPEEVPALAEKVPEDLTSRILRNSEEMVQWLNSIS